MFSPNWKSCPYCPYCFHPAHDFLIVQNHWDHCIYHPDNDDSFGECDIDDEQEDKDEWEDYDLDEWDDP